jgi:1-acyl-sn-glycerol-3-phosphate acyltransferase
LIIIFNHVNFLEVPLLYLRLKPRRVHYIAKSETWNKRFSGWMADNWQSVKVERAAPSLKAFQAARELLDKGEILLISPEGSRSEDGILRKGREGAVLMALENDSIIIPVGHTGAEKIRDNMRRLKRTRVRYRVGKAFRLIGNRHPAKEIRTELTTVMMKEIASLLPKEQRGIYKDLQVKPGLLDYQC